MRRGDAVLPSALRDENRKANTGTMKRSFDSMAEAPDGPPSDETAAQEETATAVAASRAAPGEQMISGIGGTAGVKAAVYCCIPAAEPRPSQYSIPAGEPLLFTYFAIRGLGEVPRLLLAEAGAAYNSLAVTGEEEPSDVCFWRKRSPNVSQRFSVPFPVRSTLKYPSL
jgi:hypothetical protein